jgi:transposase
MPSYGLATRAQAVILRAAGVTLKQISAVTSITTKHIKNLYNEATTRGWNPLSPLLDIHIKDKPRPGRKKQVTPEKELEIVNAVLRDRYGREKSCKAIADQCGVSPRTAWNVLRKHGFRKTKPTRKPGLTKEMKAARYAFALQHQHWTLEDWKLVIWSDETSIVLGHRRGSYRLWRRADEACHRTCIRERWAGYSEFMFWGCFTYHFKGPYHMWKQQSKKEQNIATRILNIWNQSLEPAAYQIWQQEVTQKRQDYVRYHGKRPTGRQPTWKFTAERGAFKRKSKGGIDWWRYLTFVLLL